MNAGSDEAGLETSISVRDDATLDALTASAGTEDEDVHVTSDMESGEGNSDGHGGDVESISEVRTGEEPPEGHSGEVSSASEVESGDESPEDHSEEAKAGATDSEAEPEGENTDSGNPTMVIPSTPPRRGLNPPNTPPGWAPRRNTRRIRPLDSPESPLLYLSQKRHRPGN